MFKLKYILLGIAVAFCLSGCTPEPTPFGSDNSVISFSLNKGKTTYNASIGENTIDIQISESESLKGAVPNYLVSERATIEPSFLSITDWEQTIEFTVSSFNGIKKQYTYRCIKLKDIGPGTFALNTQAEVDDFAKLKIEDVYGDLIIGQNRTLDAADSISDLSALNSLQSVSGNIVFKSSIKLNNINGFANLNKAGGIYFGTKDKAIVFSDSLSIDMPVLKDAGELILNSNFIKHISMPKLEKLQKLFIISESLKTVQFDELKEIMGEFVLYGVREGINHGGDALLNNISFPKLFSILGDLKLHKLSKLESISFAELKHVGGGMSLKELPSFLEFKVSNLEQVIGSINIEDVHNIAKLDFVNLQYIGSFYFKGYYNTLSQAINFNFSALKRVEGNFSIISAKCDELDFSNLEYIGGNLHLLRVPSLLKLEFPKLTHCKFVDLFTLENIENLDLSLINNELNIKIWGAAKLTKLKASKVKNLDIRGYLFELEGFTEVSDSLSLNIKSTNNISIPNIKRIGSLTQRDGAQNTTLSLPNLEEVENINVGGDFLVNLSLPKLKIVKGNLNLSLWRVLDDKIDIPLLSKVGGDLNINGAQLGLKAQNCPLTNLTAFASLKNVGSISIRYCGKLDDFSGLKDVISGLSALTWEVLACKYNPTYEDMKNGNYTPQD